MRLANYTVRRRFELMSHPTLRVRDLNDIDLELGLNKHHPRADITLVDPEDVCAAWRLPALCYHFFTRQHLRYNSCQICFEIAVTFVFMCKSLPKTRMEKKKKTNDHWEIRMYECKVSFNNMKV